MDFPGSRLNVNLVVAGGWNSNDADRLFFSRRNPTADLLHGRQEIADTPVVGDLAVLDAHYIDRLEVGLAVSGSDPRKPSLMRAVVGFVRRHAVAIGELPVDPHMKVRKCGTNIGVEFSHACWFLVETLNYGGDQR